MDFTLTPTLSLRERGLSVGIHAKDEVRSIQPASHFIDSRFRGNDERCHR